MTLSVLSLGQLANRVAWMTSVWGSTLRTAGTATP
jgi:hypothetical protein